MYFVHSYYAKPLNQTEILSYTTYGNTTYASSIIKENITGIQFHPEKSSAGGLSIYKKWADQI